MKPFLLFSLLFTLRCFSQQTLDLGEVIGTDVRFCDDKNTKDLCHSKFQLDIYLVDVTWPNGTYVSTELTYDGFVWTTTRYEGDLMDKMIDTFRLKCTVSCDSLFFKLRTNKIFLLPDQDQLKLKGSIDDGHEYRVYFKAAEKFRTYAFANPDRFKKHNPDIGEIDNYIAIVDVLSNSLKKE
jgi:hypothetical protein